MHIYEQPILLHSSAHQPQATPDCDNAGTRQTADGTRP